MLGPARWLRLVVVAALLAAPGLGSDEAAVWRVGRSGVELSVAPSQALSFNVSVDGAVWLEGMAPRVHCDGVWYDAAAPGAPLATPQLQWTGAEPFNGSDATGPFEGLRVGWLMAATAPAMRRRWETVFLYYPGPNALRFQQVYPDGCPAANISALPANASSATGSPTGSSTGSTGDGGSLREFGSAAMPSSGFPTFRADNGTVLGSTLGYVTWQGRFMHDHSSHGIGLEQFVGGAEGGPLLLFDESAGAGELARAGVLSTFDEFMVGIAGSQPCVRSATCSLQNHTDFYGNDLHQVNVTTVGECCAACQALAACTAFSFAPPGTPVYGSMCWLKDRASSPRSEPHISGSLCDGGPGRRDLAFGVQGFAQSLAPAYNLSFVLSFSDTPGLTNAMDHWGGLLRRAYRLNRTHDDAVSTSLGYWTDNGGYYSCRTPLTTALAGPLFANLSRQHVPVQYLQLDPYWYLDSWDPKPELFPRGLGDLVTKTRVPLLLYYNFWHAQTPALYPDYHFLYGNSNGRDLVVSVSPEESYAFHRALFRRYARDEGVMTAFEIDFMDYNFLLQPAFLAAVDKAPLWAGGMARAALELGIPMQYCMGLPAWMMQTLVMPAVNNARASEDNFPGAFDRRWQIGYTAMFLWPLDIMPFMDVVWSTPDQAGNAYGENRTNVELQGIVALLSKGPLGIGDGTGMTNATFTSHVATATGRLVHPSRPATPIDAMYFPGPPQRPAGEIWQTHSEVAGMPGAGVYHAFLVVNQPTPFQLRLGVVFPKPTAAMYLATNLKRLVQGNTACAHGSPLARCAQYVAGGAGAGVALASAAQAGGEYGYDLVFLSPVFESGAGARTALIGELGKFLPVSPARLLGVDIDAASSAWAVTVGGLPGEVVTLAFASSSGDAGRISHANATVAQSGRAVVHFQPPTLYW